MTDERYLSRRGDPVTSKIAAVEVAEEPSYEDKKVLALRILENNDGSTTKELEEFSGLGDGQIRKRISDLVKEGRVHNGEKRKCTITRRLAMTRWAGPAPSPPAPVGDQGQQFLFENREVD